MKRIMSNTLTLTIDNDKLYADQHLNVVDLVIVLYRLAPETRFACTNGDFA